MCCESHCILESEPHLSSQLSMSGQRQSMRNISVGGKVASSSASTGGSGQSAGSTRAPCNRGLQLAPACPSSLAGQSKAPPATPKEALPIVEVLEVSRRAPGEDSFYVKLTNGQYFSLDTPSLCSFASGPQKLAELLDMESAPADMQKEEVRKKSAALPSCWCLSSESTRVTKHGHVSRCLMSLAA